MKSDQDKWLPRVANHLFCWTPQIPGVSEENRNVTNSESTGGSLQNWKLSPIFFAVPASQHPTIPWFVTASQLGWTIFPFLQANLLRVAFPKRICVQVLVSDHRTPVSVRLCFACFICLFQFSSPERNPFPSPVKGAGGSFSELCPQELVSVRVVLEMVLELASTVFSNKQGTISSGVSIQPPSAWSWKCRS